MKKIIEYFGITILFALSLIYTENITNIVKNNDPIMKTIKEISNDYKIESVNAIIEDNTIVPGINGCEIDIDKSYENMKKINSYTDKMLKYKDLIPEISINSIFDKYITKGNSKERNVSIIIYVKNNTNILTSYDDIKLNIFLDSSILNNGKVDISTNKKIYNGGKYDDITIEWVNDIILDNYNSPKYCLNKDKIDDDLLVCSRNKMHTISPKLVVNSNNIYNIKSSIENGSIIYFDEKNINKLPEIKDYLTKKGFNIIYLDELLSENRCKHV